MEPYLDRTCKQYKMILTLNEMPEGPLAERAFRITLPRVSEFRDYTTQKCAFALRDEFGEYMELPQLMTYLLSNTYKIDYQMSKLLKQHSKIVCSFTYSI